METIDVPCPNCGGTVQVKKTKRGRKFYVCENNPDKCNYISWNKPKVGEKWNPEKQEKVETGEKKTRKKATGRKKKTSKKCFFEIGTVPF